MSPRLTHSWSLSPHDAVALQRELAGMLVKENRVGKVRTVAGLDASYKDGQAVAVAVLFSFPQLEQLEHVRLKRKIAFPYIPGLLSFREAPGVIEAVDRLNRKPDLLLIDAHGYSHPRRFGLASHVGVYLDVPSIGVAKTVLVGAFDEPAEEQGAVSWLRHKDEIVGAVVRTRAQVRPIFVSIGHRVNLDTAVKFTLACCRGYRLPEPTRWADRLAGEAS